MNETKSLFTQDLEQHARSDTLTWRTWPGLRIALQCRKRNNISVTGSASDRETEIELSDCLTSVNTTIETGEEGES